MTQDGDSAFGQVGTFYGTDTGDYLFAFEDKAFFVWLRWASKETIKFSFIALIFAVVLFVIVQLLNYFYFAREVSKDEQKSH